MFASFEVIFVNNKTYHFNDLLPMAQPDWTGVLRYCRASKKSEQEIDRE
jgi:hypothetical protein